MNGLKLDHRRADHPSISRKPHKQTVGRSHHIRYFIACNKCIAEQKRRRKGSHEDAVKDG